MEIWTYQNSKKLYFGIFPTASLASLWKVVRIGYFISHFSPITPTQGSSIPHGCARLARTPGIQGDIQEFRDRWKWKRDVAKLSFQTIQKRNRLKILSYRRYGKHGKKTFVLLGLFVHAAARGGTCGFTLKTVNTLIKNSSRDDRPSIST